jgi:hypothetical protein
VRYDGPAGNDDEAYDIAVGDDYSVYVTGSTSGSYSDYGTVKYNSEGNQQWYMPYDGTYSWEDEARYIAVDSGGNVYVSGISSGISPYDSDDFTVDIVTIKYNTEGDELWLGRLENTNDGTNSFIGEEIAARSCPGC